MPKTAAKKNSRGEQIVKELLREGTVSVDGLVDKLGVSPASIRRDLSELVTRGLVRRTHGGAAVVETSLYDAFRYDSSFQMREQHCTEQKRRIGLAAAELIKEGETIGITAGTTTTQVARSIRHRQNIKVITNAINIGMELCNCSGLQTFVTGGRVQWAGSFSAVGQSAITFLRDIFLDKVFVSSCGLDARRGPTIVEPDEAMTFRAMIQQAKQVIVVADSSKLGVIAPALICPISDIHILITDTDSTDEAIAPFIDQGITVERV